MRFKLAKLQAELSTCMYSEQGFDPLMRSVFELVCQALIVVSNCKPGSAHCHAAVAMSRQSLRALTVSTAVAPSRLINDQSPSAMTAFMKSSDTRTELLAFWYWME